MRNLSMKKFGTPIGAAPGVASEKVGLLSVGAPSTARPRCFFLVLAACLRTVPSTSPTRSLGSMLPARKEPLRLRGSRARVGSVLAPRSPSPVAPPWPPSVRLGAPGVLLPSGVGAEGTDDAVG